MLCWTSITSCESIVRGLTSVFALPLFWLFDFKMIIYIWNNIRFLSENDVKNYDVKNFDIINFDVIDCEVMNCDVINGNRLRGKLISRSRAFIIGKLSKPWWFTVGFHGLLLTVWFYHCISFKNEIKRGVFQYQESTDRTVGLNMRLNSEKIQNFSLEPK